MKKLTLACLAALSACTCFAKWYNGCSYYVISEENKIAQLCHTTATEARFSTLSAFKTNPTGDYVLSPTIAGYTLTSIGWYAFYQCTGLRTVTLPDAIDLICDYGFKQCTGLCEFKGPAALKTINDFAFQGCTSLTNVVLPDATISIAQQAFGNCTKLSHIRLSPKLKVLDFMAFSKCSALRDLILPEALTQIGNRTFEYCTSLTELSIPSNVTSIGYRAFDGCSKLTSVQFEGSRPSVAADIYNATPAGLVTRVLHYDDTWSNALANATWCSRAIVCERDWDISFDLGTMGVRTGGGELRQTVFTGKAATAPTVASIDEDYVFSGWDRSFSDIRFFTTVTAVYTPKPLALKGSSSVSMMRFDDGASIQLAALGGVKPYTWSVVSGLPAGLSVSSGGVISGNTATLGAATVKVRVTDSRNVSTTLTYALTVIENTNRKPVIDAANPASSPVVGRGATNTLAVTAHDPEGKALDYRWFVDGVEKTDASGASFKFVEPNDGVFTHTVRCAVEDPVWKLGYTTETNWTVRTLMEPVISPADGKIFEKGTGTVSIACNIPEAEIFYAIDLSPRLTDRFRYAGPFTVGTSCVVRAIARSGTYLTDYVSASFTCATPAFSDPVGAGPKMQFTTGGDADWTPDGKSLRSGAVAPNGESWLKAVFAGKGTLSFSWRTDCEHDIDGTCSWDALEVYVDGRAERFAAIDDISDWTAIEIPIAEKGDHEILWRFVRDDYDDDGTAYLNCGWIASVHWAGEALPVLSLEATAADVAEVFAEAADGGLAAHVTTAARYGRFRTWALDVDAAGEGENVLAHSRAWTSFALAQPSLLECDLTDADLKVKSFAATASGSGAFALTASVGSIAVGSTADPSDLAELLGVAGSTTLNETSFSSENVNATFSAPVEGCVPVIVSPKTAAPAFFFRLHLR